MAERRVDVAAARFDSAALETNKVLKNTYMLLGMTLAFSAITCRRINGTESPSHHGARILNHRIYSLVCGSPDGRQF
jgi:FtsH-binding integral membrane protein